MPHPTKRLRNDPAESTTTTTHALHTKRLKHTTNSSDDDSDYAASDSAPFNSSSHRLNNLQNDLLRNQSFLINFAKQLRDVKTLDANQYSNSVIKVSGIYRQFDYSVPYHTPTQAKGHGSGFVVSYKDEVFIMSNAHVVNDALNLTVQFANDATLYTATVELIENDCDLSILKIDDPEFWRRAKPLALTLGNPQLLDPVVRAGFPIGGEEICLSEGSVSRIEIDSYVQSDASLLQFQVSANQNPGNSGGPVINNKHEVIGVSFQSSHEGANLFYTIPAQIVRRFLDAVIKAKHEKKPYYGFPDLALYHQELEHAETRRALGVENKSGVYIRYINPMCSSAQQLKVGDVLIKLDGKDIKNDGTIETEFSKHLDMSYLYTSKHIGDTITATVIRNGVQLELQIELKYRAATTSLVSSIEYDKPPTFYIYCGVVFTVFTENLRDEVEVEDDFGCSSDESSGAKKSLGDEQVLILSVLHNEYTKHAINIGSEFVQTVNGVKIKNLRHLIKTIEQNESPSILIKANTSSIIGLPKLTPAENLELLKVNKIYMDRSEDLLAPPVYKPGCPEYEAEQAKLAAIASTTNKLSA